MSLDAVASDFDRWSSRYDGRHWSEEKIRDFMIQWDVDKEAVRRVSDGAPPSFFDGARNIPATRSQARHPWTASYRINAPRNGWCCYHLGTCHVVLTFETSRYPDFRRVRHLWMCWDAYTSLREGKPPEIMGPSLPDGAYDEYRPEHFSGSWPYYRKWRPIAWKDHPGEDLCWEIGSDSMLRYVRKWHAPSSMTYPEERDAFLDEFCYAHLGLECGPVSSLVWGVGGDVVGAAEGTVACWKAFEEKLKEGWATWRVIL